MQTNNPADSSSSTSRSLLSNSSLKNSIKTKNIDKLMSKSCLDEENINIYSYLSVTELEPPKTKNTFENESYNSKPHTFDIANASDFHLALNYENLYGYDFESLSTNSQYLKYLQNRAKRWSLLTEQDLLISNKSNKIKRFVKKGIPQDNKLRMLMWYRYSGGEQANKKNELYYTNMKTNILSKKGINIVVDDSIIFNDINRTLPDNLVMKHNMKIKQKIFNIIKATLLSFDNCDLIDYHQCFSYIVAVLVLVMEEEKAYWTFNRTIKKIMPKNIYKLTNKAHLVETGVILSLLKQNMNELYTLLINLETQEGMPSLSIAIQHWIILMFVDVLNIECLMRLFDMVYYMGYKVLIRCSLAIFKLNEKQIVQMVHNKADKMEVFQYIKQMPKSITNPNDLIATMNLAECKVKSNQIKKHRKLVDSQLTEI